MINKKRCIYCNCIFHPLPHVLNQMYCSKAECQKERKRKWIYLKFKCDQDYKDTQKAYWCEWKNTNRGYWQQYRAKHPEYVKREKLNSKKRKARKAKKARLNNVTNEETLKILISKQTIVELAGCKKANCRLIVLKRFAK